MWLLNARTRKLEHFIDPRQVKGRYAILSHTWGEDEVTFEKLRMPGSRVQKGYKKIEYTCGQALKDGLEYAWIDTCCIDKRSSAELSEAINSMYRWYYDANVCYVYLADLTMDLLEPGSRNTAELLEDINLSRSSIEALHRDLFERLQRARWFTRGWTLQELLAPQSIHFYDSKWSPLGSKEALCYVISAITKIEPIFLSEEETSKAPASLRECHGLREEPRHERKTRLQEEIIGSQAWPDHSILVHSGSGGGLLAHSAREFESCNTVVSWAETGQRPVFSLTSSGLEIRSYLLKYTVADPLIGLFRGQHERAEVFVLNCSDTDVRTTRYALKLRSQPAPSRKDDQEQHNSITEKVFDRRSAATILHRSDVADGSAVTVYISRVGLRVNQMPTNRISLETYPAPAIVSISGEDSQWDQSWNVLNINAWISGHTGEETSGWSGKCVLRFPMLDSTILARVRLRITSCFLDDGVGPPFLRIWPSLSRVETVGYTTQDAESHDSWEPLPSMTFLDGESSCLAGGSGKNGSRIMFKANYVSIAHEMLWRLDLAIHLDTSELE